MTDKPDLKIVPPKPITCDGSCALNVEAAFYFTNKLTPVAKEFDGRAKFVHAPKMKSMTYNTIKYQLKKGEDFQLVVLAHEYCPYCGLKYDKPEKKVDPHA